MGTAFVLLLTLTFAISIFGWLIGPEGRFGSKRREAELLAAERENYDKAVAAVVAVTTLSNTND